MAERDDRNAPASGKRDAGQMTLLDHLDELRSMLIHSLLAVVVAGCICWFFSKPLLDLLVQPILSTGNQVYFHQPVEAFLTRMKLALVAGLFLVLPYVLWRIYRFVMPGLYRNERRIVAPVLLSSSLLFYTGVAFAYLILIPKVVAFMLGFATETMLPLIGIGSYFAFVARLCLAFGLVFELPLAVLMLTSFGIVSPSLLLKGWRWALLVIVTLSALLTPPDVLSQLLMAGPVMLLYLGSVGVSFLVRRRGGRELQDPED